MTTISFAYVKNDRTFTFLDSGEINAVHKHSGWPEWIGTWSWDASRHELHIRIIPDEFRDLFNAVTREQIGKSYMSMLAKDIVT